MGSELVTGKHRGQHSRGQEGRPSRQQRELLQVKQRLALWRRAEVPAGSRSQVLHLLMVWKLGHFTRRAQFSQTLSPPLHPPR